jgi:hypothetical protein
MSKANRLTTWENDRYLRAGVFAILAVILALSALSARYQASAPPFRPEELTPVPQTTWKLPKSPNIEAMSDTITAVLERCEIEFTGADGDVVRGFVPGADYPMIFARDTSTLLQTATYYYSGDRLASPVEEFLRLQYNENTTSDEDGVAAGLGAISAVIAPDGHIHKATVVSDEETHLLHAAHVYYKTAGGEAWLRQDIHGEAVIARLNGALEWLYAHRLDETTGLIKRAHTTDWGDVKIEPAVNPTDIDPDSDHWTASIYDQALTHRTLLELADMNTAVGDSNQAQKLQHRADTLREQVQALLWQPDKGFYLTHLHLTPLTHPFDETEIVSIANAVAVRCGLADEEQAGRIFKWLEQVREDAGAGKPGIVLYPPYPDGTFAAERMRPGHYQNGALWDWWAGWQVLGEFEAGNARLGREHLAQIAGDWVERPSKIFEWQTIDDNAGFGPVDYAGAAGTVGESIVAGLFGVSVDKDGVELRPRLGEQEGFVRVYQPSTDRYAAYRYTPRTNALYLDYGTDGPEPVRIAVLLPPGHEVQEVRLDEQTAPHEMETVGNDHYVITEAPAGIHRLAISVHGG